MGAAKKPQRDSGKGLVPFILGPFAFELYPELKLARSAFERTEASARAKMMRKPTLATSAPLMIIALGVGLSVALFPRYRPYWMPEWFLVIGILASAALAAAVGLLTARESARRSIRKFLLSRGIPLCLRCGYDLRGLPPDGPEPVCPECAHGISPEAVKILKDATEQ